MPEQHTPEGEIVPLKVDTQCVAPVAVTTEGPAAKAFCWGIKGVKCAWAKTFVIPETGIDMNKLQSEHNGETV